MNPRAFLCIMLLLACIVGTGGAGECQTRIKKAPEQTIVGEVNKRRLKRLIDELTVALSRNPNNFILRYERGLRYLESNDYARAANDFGAAIRLCQTKPDLITTRTFLWQSLAQRGYISMMQGNYQQGIDDLSRSITMQAIADSYKNRGLGYAKLGKQDLASADFAKARELAKVKENPDVDWPVLRDMANVFQLLSTYSQTDLRTLAHRASCNMALGKYADAAEEYKLLSEQQPNDFQLVSMKRAAEKLRQRYGSSMCDYDHVTAATYYWYRQVDECTDQKLKKRDFACALPLFEECLKSFPNDFQSVRCLYVMHISLGRQADAQADMSAMIKTDPTNRYSYQLRAQGYDKLKKYRAAISDYSKILSFDAGSSYTRPIAGTIDEIYFKRAADWMKLGDYEAALKDYSAIVDSDPEMEEAYRARGDCYAARGSFKQAIADYSTAINLDKQSKASSLLARANLYDKIGNKELADADRAKVKCLKDRPLTRSSP